MHLAPGAKGDFHQQELEKLDKEWEALYRKKYSSISTREDEKSYKVFAVIKIIFSLFFTAMTLGMFFYIFYEEFSKEYGVVVTVSSYVLIASLGLALVIFLANSFRKKAVSKIKLLEEYRKDKEHYENAKATIQMMIDQRNKII